MTAASNDICARLATELSYRHESSAAKDIYPWIGIVYLAEIETNPKASQLQTSPDESG